MEFRRGLWRPLTGQTGNDAQCDLRTPWTWRAQCVLFAENDTSTIQIQSLNAENNKLVHNLITLINWRSLKFSSLTHNANYFLFYVAVNVRVIDIAEILISFDREPTIFFCVPRSSWFFSSPEEKTPLLLTRRLFVSNTFSILVNDSANFGDRVSLSKTMHVKEIRCWHPDSNGAIHKKKTFGDDKVWSVFMSTAKQAVHTLFTNAGQFDRCHFLFH